jgi:hypothetical protein
MIKQELNCDFEANAKKNCDLNCQAKKFSQQPTQQNPASGTAERSPPPEYSSFCNTTIYRTFCDPRTSLMLVSYSIHTLSTFYTNTLSVAA